MGLLEPYLLRGCQQLGRLLTNTHSTSAHVNTRLTFTPIYATQVRFARSGKVKMKKSQKGKKRKEERAAEIALQAQLAMKEKSIINEYPVRIINETRPERPTQSVDNVLFTDRYRPLVYSVQEALSMHRQMMQPMIYNNPDALVRLRLDMNMNTEKTRRFLVPRRQLVKLPYPFPVQDRRDILALSQDENVLSAATEAGAMAVGGNDIIKRIQKMTYRSDDFDYIVADRSVVDALPAARTILRTKWPTEQNNCLGDDLVELVQTAINSAQFSLRQDTIFPEYGLVDTLVGTLDQPFEELEANIAAMLQAVGTIRHNTKKLGHCIGRALVMLEAHGPQEYFAIDHLLYVPMDTDDSKQSVTDDDDDFFTEDIPDPDELDEEED